MKELDKLKRDSERLSIEQVQKKKQKQEFKWVSSLRPKEGHQVWEVNEKTLEVKLAEHKKEDVLVVKSLKHLEHLASVGNKKEIILKKGCVYISSLNANSALKRYLSGKGSAIKPEGRADIDLW